MSKPEENALNNRRYLHLRDLQRIRVAMPPSPGDALVGTRRTPRRVVPLVVEAVQIGSGAGVVPPA